MQVAVRRNGIRYRNRPRQSNSGFARPNQAAQAAVKAQRSPNDIDATGDVNRTDILAAITQAET